MPHLTSHDSPTGRQWIFVQSELEAAEFFGAIVHIIAKDMSCSHLAVIQALHDPEGFKLLKTSPHCLYRTAAIFFATLTAAGGPKNSADKDAMTKELSEIFSNPQTLAKVIRSITRPQ